MTLAERATGRDNNFNLLRATLAAMVLVHHANVLTGNPVAPDDLLRRMFAGLGEIGVGGFFIVSGFLVTQSLLARATVAKFALARTLRIFPGLIVMLLITTTALSAFSTLSPAAYFTDFQTWRYVAGNATALLTSFELPGVFQDAPEPAVNGSLWSLRYEILCYIALGLAGALGLARRRWFILGVAIAMGLAWVTIHSRLPFAVGLMVQTGFLFALGAAAAAWADRIRLRFVAMAALFALALLLDTTMLARIGWSVAFAYLLLWFAYVPKGALLAFNRLPDVSYGLYIYAFPIQQAAIVMGLGVAPLANFAWAAPATLICATLSWYLIEKPSLALKNSIGRRKDPRAAA